MATALLSVIITGWLVKSKHSHWHESSLLVKLILSICAWSWALTTRHVNLDRAMLFPWEKYWVSATLRICTCDMRVYLLLHLCWLSMFTSSYIHMKCMRIPDGMWVSPCGPLHLIFSHLCFYLATKFISRI